MELELKKNCLNYFRLESELSWTQEETTETIVPDYCPDIARIISANGTVYLHSREMRDHQVEMRGSIRLTVLYVPEREGGIRNLEINIPFTTESERGAFADRCALLADTQIEFLETRMLNPRKVFTHCKLVHRASVYENAQMCYCSDIEADDDLCLEKLTENRNAILLTAITEKDFTFTEELSISSGRCGAAELLSNQVTPTVTETKLVGNKLIVKGMFYVQILYRGTDGTYAMTNAEMPFSQIMEAEAVGDHSIVTLFLQLTGTEFQIIGDSEDRKIGVTFYLHAIAQIRESRSLQLLSDLYSTTWETAYEALPLHITAGYRSFNHRQTVREVLEFGSTAESLLALWVTCGPVSVHKDDRTVMRTTVLIRALVADENGTPMLAERRVEVIGHTEQSSNQKFCVRASCLEMPQVALVDRGMEVRFSVDFAVESSDEQKRICISSVKLNKDVPRDMSGVPSLVLRRLGQHESVWDLAKSCNSSIKELLSANQIENEEDIPMDRLLLIPRKRA